MTSRGSAPGGARASAPAFLRFLLVSLACAPTGACHAAGTRVTNVLGIDVAEGVNNVQRFAPDGRQAIIVEGRQAGPGSAPVYLVMLPRSTPVRGWDVVGVADGTGRIASGPSEAGPAAQSIRFARGKVGGLPATLMFIASAAGQGRFRIVTYRLVTDGDDGSGLSAVFDPIHTSVVDLDACSPAIALESVEDLDPEPGDACPRA